jgi:predicted hydrocarbon binding protein
MSIEAIKLSNALKINRPELGDQAGVGLYRLLRLVALEDILGQGASAISYYAGKKLGSDLGLKTVDDFLELCDQLKIGIIKIPEMRDDFIHVDVHECVTCSGLEPVGRALCHFEGGLIAGAVESILGKTVNAKEVTCIGGFGDETCGFDLEIK